MSTLRRIILITAALLAVIAVLSLVYFNYNQPTKLTIAVGPPDSYDARLVDAIAQRLQSRRESVQLKVIYTEGSAASSEALDSGKVDLAVIRGDLPKQPSAGLVLTLHRDPALFIAPPKSDIKNINDLKGKNIGVIRARASDSEALSINTLLLKVILTYYGLDNANITLVSTTLNEALKGLDDKKIDIIFSVNAMSDQGVMNLIDNITKKRKSLPVFIPIAEADAIILKNPLLLKEEIVKGAFGGQPPTPKDAFTTLVVSHSIAASNTLSDTVVADLVRTILKMRPILARDMKSPLNLEVPSSDKNAAMTLHSGAAAYIDNEEQSFFDKYGDMFYISAMLFGVLGSGFAALFSRWSSNTRKMALLHIKETIGLVSEVRGATSVNALTIIEHRIDELVELVVLMNEKNHLTPTDLSSFNLAINHARQTVNDKKQHLLKSE